MSRLTLRLPETLHKQLEAFARHEAVSLNPAYAALLQGLGQATFPEIEKALADREKVEPEPGLRPEVVRTMKRRIAGRSS